MLVPELYAAGTCDNQDTGLELRVPELHSTCSIQLGSHLYQGKIEGYRTAQRLDEM